MLRRFKEKNPELFNRANDFFDAFTNYMANAHDSLCSLKLIDDELVEDEKSYTLNIPVPSSIGNSDVKLSINNENQVTVEIEKTDDSSDYYAKIVRTIPEDTERYKAVSTLKNGVLSISVPKVVKPKMVNEEYSIPINFDE